MGEKSSSQKTPLTDILQFYLQLVLGETKSKRYPVEREKGRERERDCGPPADVAQVEDRRSLRARGSGHAAENQGLSLRPTWHEIKSPLLPHPSGSAGSAAGHVADGGDQLVEADGWDSIGAARTDGDWPGIRDIIAGLCSLIVGLIVIIWLTMVRMAGEILSAPAILLFTHGLKFINNL